MSFPVSLIKTCYWWENFSLFLCLFCWEKEEKKNQLTKKKKTARKRNKEKGGKKKVDDQERKREKQKKKKKKNDPNFLFLFKMEIEKKKKNWTTREFQKKKILRDACFFCTTFHTRTTKKK